MTAKLPQHLQSVVDTICHLGCNRVNEIIAELERNAAPQEVAQLTTAERDQVLAELKHIMSVYDSE